MQSMTKKRFIKLLMGELRYSRNKARAYADDVIRWRKKANLNNTIWKNAGDFMREIPPTYSGYYALIKITELSKQLAAQEGESKWNSITKSSS